MYRPNPGNRNLRVVTPSTGTPLISPQVIYSDDWSRFGSCQSDQRAKTVMFPDKENFPSNKAYKDAIGQAQQICAGCPVQDLCLTSAIDSREPHGVWGGATERERRELRRDLAAQKVAYNLARIRAEALRARAGMVMVRRELAGVAS